MTNIIQLSTTHKTHDFLSRLNQEQKLEREIFEFVNAIEIKNSTLNRFRSKFIDLYWNNNYYVPNKNSYLKLFVTLITYLQNAELGDNIKNIPWFCDKVYPNNFHEKYEFTFIEHNKGLFGESSNIIICQLTITIVDNHLHDITLN